MPNYERSFAAPHTFADEHIERWALVYRANPQLRAHGVLFETFLHDPVAPLLDCALPAMSTSTCGLLPRQRAAQERIDTEAALR